MNGMGLRSGSLGRLVAAGVIVVATSLAAADSLVDAGESHRLTEEEARQRVQRGAAVVEKIRGKKFKKPVEVHIQSVGDFRKYVDRELDREFPVGMARRQSLALQAFGLLPKGYDLRKGLSDLYVSQAGAYYDPETRAFYVLFAGLPDAQMNSLIVHELTHALQDQYFELGSMRETALKNPNEDARAALAYVFEGEASFIMTLDQLRSTGQAFEGMPVGQQELVFGMLRSVDRDALLLAARSVLPQGAGGEDIRRSIDALSEVPDYLFSGLHDPYLEGQYSIYKRYQAEKWSGVDELFSSPPASTEQMLHPEKLGQPRDEPVEVVAPGLGKELEGAWREVYSNTMGEAGVVAFFHQHAPGEKDRASAGWDGDKFTVYEDEKDRLLLVWRSAWDDVREAEEFAGALRQVGPAALCGGGPEIGAKLDVDKNEVLFVAGPGDVPQLVMAANQSGRTNK